MRLVRDTILFTAAEMPRWHPVSISGYHIREAGSTAAEELAFTLANGFAYVELALQAGLPIDSFAPRLSFFFNAHIDFFEEIAKYRAARRIWARWMRERYGAQLERSLQLRFHTQTAGVSLTAQQPEVNIVRTAIEALAGVLGGTQSLHTNSMDEAMALPTEKAARIALRTQQVIAYETNVVNVADPLGGSYFVEELTDEMERRAEELFAHLDDSVPGRSSRAASPGSRRTGSRARSPIRRTSRIDSLVAHPLEPAGRPLDGPLDGVGGHRRLPGLGVHGAQRGVGRHVGPTLPRRHLDLAQDLGEDLGPHLVLGALLVLDGCPFGVAGHGVLLRG